MIWIYERYRDDAALAAHQAGEALGDVRGHLADLLAAPVTLTMLTPLAGTPDAR